MGHNFNPLSRRFRTKKKHRRIKLRCIGALVHWSGFQGLRKVSYPGWFWREYQAGTDPVSSSRLSDCPTRARAPGAQPTKMFMEVMEHMEHMEVMEAIYARR